MLNGPGPGYEGAPTFPRQETWIRYTTDDIGRINGVWAYNLNGDEVRLPVSMVHKDWPITGAAPTYTFEVPSAFVSEAR